MSDPLDDLALDISCADCGARPGDWCRTIEGYRTTALHSPRTNAVHSAFVLGYTQGLGEKPS